MVIQDFTKKTKELIDGLKATCASYGLGNDGNEFKIITQTFLYKFINDKFIFESKKIEPKLANINSWDKAILEFSDDEYEMLQLSIGTKAAKLKREHFLSYLYNQQNQPEFSKLFDDTLQDIALENNELYSVKTESNAKIKLFDELSQYISDPSKRDSFCRALINHLVNFSFEGIFNQKFDFFSTIFEYLIKDYNKDGGGKYAEYYTPHAVSKIMAAILVDSTIQNVTCYDPSAGSGTLLMNIAHAIGEDRCTIYSQDISQKSSGMLRLNLILNNLVHSIPNVIQGNTLQKPAHPNKQFDFIVSNPPFKLDFSDFRDDLENDSRFFAGIPKVPNKDKDKMSIYLLFIQHIIHSLSEKGKAAIVVPTGFLTAQSGIEKKIREKMIQNKMLRGVVSMPSNIFANTGTNVSILFLDKNNQKGNIVLMDASKLGTTIKEGKNQKTVLSDLEENKIINIFLNHHSVEDLSVVVSYDEIIEKNYSFSAGQYFEVVVNYSDITPNEFKDQINEYQNNLNQFFEESKRLENEIQKQLKELRI